jgi:hypothetical protein
LILLVWTDGRLARLTSKKRGRDNACWLGLAGLRSSPRVGARPSPSAKGEAEKGTARNRPVPFFAPIPRTAASYAGFADFNTA